jgi:hypothetical protein
MAFLLVSVLILFVLSILESKLKILETLIHQLLTFGVSRDFIDDNIERIKGVKQDLRQHQWAEERRRKDETTFW